jgi:predicted negative regulator of RcsB-dependent stress response
MTNTEAASDKKPAEAPVFLEDRLKQAWERYATAVYVLCGLVIAGMLAKGGLDYLNVQKELEIQKEYAACATPEAFKAFAAEHRSHPLGAMVELKLADEAFLGGKFAEAVTNYEKAVADLPAGPFQSRAKLGLAASLVRSGKAAEAEASLRKILNDAAEYKALRCEAGYDLAELAVSGGHPGDVQNLATQLMQIDPTSPFAERAFALRSELGPGAGAAPPIAVPAVR